MTDIRWSVKQFSTVTHYYGNPGSSFYRIAIRHHKQTYRLFWCGCWVNSFDNLEQAKTAAQTVLENKLR